MKKSRASSTEPERRTQIGLEGKLGGLPEGGAGIKRAESSATDGLRKPATGAPANSDTDVHQPGRR